MKVFKISKKEILPTGEALIEGEIAVEAVKKEESKVIESLKSNTHIDGFRKGHVPEKIIVERVGELYIYEEAASKVLEKNYIDVIKESKVDVIGFPKISITKISVGSPVDFKITALVMPEFKLADYKKIAGETKSEEEMKIEDNEISQVLDDMRRSLAHHEMYHNPENKNQDLSHRSHPAEGDHTGKDIPEEELPQLNDEFAKKIGNFENLETLKEKIKESLINEKKIKSKEKNRLKIIENIIEKSEINIPVAFVDNEIYYMISDFQENLKRMGIKFEDYLKQINKKEEDLKNELREDAKKRVKIQLVLKRISEEEKIDIEKVWEFLEGQKS